MVKVRISPVPQLHMLPHLHLSLLSNHLHQALVEAVHDEVILLNIILSN